MNKILVKFLSAIVLMFCGASLVVFCEGEWAVIGGIMLGASLTLGIPIIIKGKWL